MNELNLTYNRFAKILSLAATDGRHQNEKALLGYTEAFQIFEDYQDSSEQGVCLTNIGTIMMQKEDYAMAYVCFSESEEFMSAVMEQAARDRQGDGGVDDELPINKFILACRQFQKGLANMELLRQQNPNR